MYHIKNDKRIQNSAEKLLAALTDCLKTKSISDIGFTDLQKASGVGRSTIYRLFDTPVDILSWGCDRAAERMDMDYNRELDKGNIKNGEFALFVLRRWMAEYDLVEAILGCRRTDLLEKSLKPYAEKIPLPAGILAASRSEGLYYESIVAASFAATIVIWLREGKKETPEQLYSMINACLKL